MFEGYWIVIILTSQTLITASLHRHEPSDNWSAIMIEWLNESKLWHGAFQNNPKLICNWLNCITTPVYLRICEKTVQYSQFEVYTDCTDCTNTVHNTTAAQSVTTRSSDNINLVTASQESELNNSEFFLVNWKCLKRKLGSWEKTLDGWESKYESGCMHVCCGWVPASTRPQSDARHGNTSQTIIIYNKTS